MNKAYKTTCVGYDSIVPAETANRARYITKLAAQNAGFTVDWREIRAVRYPLLDQWAKDARVICWDPGVLKDFMP